MKRVLHYLLWLILDFHMYTHLHDSHLLLVHTLCVSNSTHFFFFARIYYPFYYFCNIFHSVLGDAFALSLTRLLAANKNEDEKNRIKQKKAKRSISRKDASETDDASLQKQLTKVYSAFTHKNQCTTTSS